LFLHRRNLGLDFIPKVLGDNRCIDLDSLGGIRYDEWFRSSVCHDDDDDDEWKVVVVVVAAVVFA
jgi:hypothetical protein